MAKPRISTVSFAVCLMALLDAAAVVIGSGGTHTASRFCYEQEDCGPKTWGGFCATGKFQSPVDIPPLTPNNLENVRETLSLSRGYYEEQDFSVENNGHSVQVTIASDLAPELTASGSLLGSSYYTFAQLHFHWGPDDSQGSEHTIGGESAPMEVHLVHYRSDFASLQDAIASYQPYAVMVLGVLYRISEEDNPELERIVDRVGDVSEAGSKTSGHGLVISKLLPSDAEGTVSVAAYYGSLTTPGCEQVVYWNVVLPQPGEPGVSSRQLVAFRSLKDSNHNPMTSNARPVQDRTARILYYETTVAPSG